LVNDADVNDLDAIRRRERETLKAEGHPGAKLTLLAFIVKAVAKGLIEYPMFACSLDPVRSEIVYKRYYNIGIAVASPKGLVVPVLRDCDRKSVVEIAAGIVELAERANSDDLTVDDFQGGTFTITNMGPLGCTNLIPTINYPEVGILGLATAGDKPVVRAGKVVVRTILPLTLALDHRVADGADAAGFVGSIKRRLENPNRMMIET
jgi:pyruvate/2-oxoglutarate dehydrogenase complex dihydrolipoamide acyltransferase (E2) component